MAHKTAPDIVLDRFNVHYELNRDCSPRLMCWGAHVCVLLWMFAEITVEWRLAFPDIR
jgi:hypothetical protein